MLSCLRSLECAGRHEDTSSAARPGMAARRGSRGSRARRAPVICYYSTPDVRNGETRAYGQRRPGRPGAARGRARGVSRQPGRPLGRAPEAVMFQVGLTRDFLMPDGSLAFGDIRLDLLEQPPGVKHEFLAENTKELTADQVRDFDALLVLAPRVTGATLAGADRPTVLARFGVGYHTL